MSRKLLSILVLLLLIFGIYNFRQGILDNYVSENINTLDKVTTKEIEFKNKNKKQVEEHKETKEERLARIKREWGEEDED